MKSTILKCCRSTIELVSEKIEIEIVYRFLFLCPVENWWLGKLYAEVKNKIWICINATPSEWSRIGQAEKDSTRPRLGHEPATFAIPIRRYTNWATRRSREQAVGWWYLYFDISKLTNFIHFSIDYTSVLLLNLSNYMELCTWVKNKVIY